MKENIAQSQDYANWVREIKTRIRQSQIKASLAVNHELISLHWDLGKSIITKQAETNWGDGLINQLAGSLKSEFPDLSGFSRENLYYMKRFYVAYNQHITIMEQLVPQLQTEKVEQPVPQIAEEKTKDNLNVEFALRDINKPIGVSEFTFKELPQQIQNAMPTVEELERELFKDDNNA